jgi:hypothetical protein
MKRWLTMLVLAMLTVGLAGCSGDSDKGILRHKDRPVPPPTGDADKGDKK